MKKSGILADAQRKTGLADALRNSGATVAAAPAPAANPTPAAAAATAKPRLVTSQPVARAKAAVAPSRMYTKSFTVHLPEEVRRQVKMMAVEQGRTMDDLVSEGLNLLFARHRKPELAPRKNGKMS